MKPEPNLKRFEQMALRARADAPPEVRVVRQVLSRVRRLYPEADPTLAVMAFGSCTVALCVTLLGLWLFTGTTEPLDLLFDIVPPIGL